MTKIFCRQASQFVKTDECECERKDNCIHSEFAYCPKTMMGVDKQ